MKKFRVTLTRTITVECSVVVSARNDMDAVEKVQNRADSGKLGEPYVSFREHGKTKDVELDMEDTTEEIQANEAFEEEE